MEHPSELLKTFTNRLARLAISEDGIELTRLLRLTGLMGGAAAPISVPTTSEQVEAGEPPSEASAPAEDAGQVGIWEGRRENGKIYFGRSLDKISEWNFWANVGRIEPKGTKRRVVLIGESVARGYLYDPEFTVAMALELMLESSFGKGEVEVVDLARTNLGLEVKELAESALLLEPDAVVIFAGNNWKGSMAPEASKVPYVDTILREQGLPGLKRYAEVELVAKVRELIDEISSLYKSKAIPLVWVLPEFNLGDWRDPITNAPHLPEDLNRQWIILRQAAEKALLDGNYSRARELAGQMVELDQGVVVAGLYILAECSQHDGDQEAARRYLEQAKDVAVTWDTSKNISPRMYSVAQETLRAEVKDHGDDLVDLPQLYKQYQKGELPGRKLFLDYCHLTSEGIRIAMAATASCVVRALTGSEVEWQRMMEQWVGPSREIEAEAAFLAAIHNAHWWQNYDLVEHYCMRAVQSTPEIAQVMTQFLDLQTRRAPMLMCQSAEQIAGLGSPLIQHYLLRYNHQQLDNVLLKAVVSALKKAGIEAGERLDQLRREEHSVTGQDINLLDYYYNSAGLQPQETMWAVPSFENVVDHAVSHYYKAYWLESKFVFVGEAKCAVQLRLTCRLPQLAMVQGQITIAVNEERLGETVINRKWETWELEVGPEMVRDGLNEVVIRWPVPVFPGLKGLNAVAGDLMEKNLPEFFCVFGEIHTFVAADPRNKRRDAVALAEVSSVHEVQSVATV